MWELLKDFLLVSVGTGIGVMIRPHGAVLPTRMGIVEILMELSKAVCLLVKNDTQ